MKRNHDFQTIRSEGGLLPPDLLRREVCRSRRRRISLGYWRKEEDQGSEGYLEIDSRTDSRSRNYRVCRRSKRGSLAAK
jgi:hypothetical protein